MGDASQRGPAAGTVVLMNHTASVRVHLRTATHCCSLLPLHHLPACHICPPLTFALLTYIHLTSSCAALLLSLNCYHTTASCHNADLSTVHTFATACVTATLTPANITSSCHTATLDIPPLISTSSYCCHITASCRVANPCHTATEICHTSQIPVLLPTLTSVPTSPRKGTTMVTIHENTTRPERVAVFVLLATLPTESVIFSPSSLFR